MLLHAELDDAERAPPVRRVVVDEIRGGVLEGDPAWGANRSCTAPSTTPSASSQNAAADLPNAKGGRLA